MDVHIFSEGLKPPTRYGAGRYIYIYKYLHGAYVSGDYHWVKFEILSNMKYVPPKLGDFEWANVGNFIITLRAHMSIWDGFSITLV